MYLKLYHPHPSSWACTIGQKWLQYKGLSPTPVAIKELFYLNIASNDKELNV
jgi:hypothetical protein